MRILNLYWGKKDDASGGRHPLLAHMLDVAAVITGLFEAPWLVERWRIASGQTVSEALLQRLRVLACLHDIGKLATGFQLRGQGYPYGCNHIEALNSLDFQHFKRTFASFWQHLGSKPRQLSEWLTLIFSHHGCTCVPGRATPHGKAFWQPHAGLDPRVALEELAAELKGRFPLAFQPPAHGLLPENPVCQHMFLGLLMLADWIASDRGFFPFCGEAGRPDPEHDPWPYALEAAAKALQTIGLRNTSPRPFVCPPFTGQFPHIIDPRPVQLAVDALPVAPEGGSLLILEAETGNGKTEAALRHFTRLVANGAVDALYFANPLRFAARQLHERVSAFARSLPSPGGVVLALPGYVRMDEIEGRHLPAYEVVWQDADMGLRGWAAEHPKRFLCAPLGVGTVDQALLAALRVPHAQLRAAALQRSLLVIDEVHASDAYMTQITCALLDYFRRTGGHVLLMSATLGAGARARYLAAWRGQTFSRALAPGPEEAVALPYPRLELISGSSPEPVILHPSSTGRRKRVNICCHQHMTDAEQVACLALACLDQGCVLVLRNTVRQARLTLAALRRLAPTGALFQIQGRAAPHHSRYAAEDRQALDAAVQSLFGKDARRPAVILVATQTLEQSLDVDFDTLITDLCPADVLLQRIGRLHRHERKRHGSPHCHVLTPGAGENWLLSPEARRFGFGRERAYENLAAVLQTWRIAATSGLWTLPDDNRRLVELATHPEGLDELVGQMGQDWIQAAQRYDGVGFAQGQHAWGQRLHWDEAVDEPNNLITRELAASISTRLGAADALLRFAHTVESPLGQRISQIRLPHWMLDAASLNGNDTVELSEEEGNIGFEAGGRRFYYTETGLLTEREWEETCTTF